jgi:hypothetical protein
MSEPKFEPTFYRFYMISNAVNDDVYIGKTSITIEERFAQHKQTAKTHPNNKLYKMFRRLGDYQFHIEELESFMCNFKYESDAKEDYWINRYNPTLNTCEIKSAKYDDDAQSFKILRKNSPRQIKNMNEKKKQKYIVDKLNEEQRLENMTSDEQDDDFIKRRNIDNKILKTRAKVKKGARIQLEDIFGE